LEDARHSSVLYLYRILSGGGEDVSSPLRKWSPNEYFLKAL
jgi:hypothetical protein